MIELNALVLAGLIYLKDKEQEKNKMKEFDRKDVYSVLNAEDASQYVGKKGYFAHTLSGLKDKVYKNILSPLDDVNQLNDYPFITDGECYLFFIPENKVKGVEEPKKWRAFRTFEEFVLVVGLIGCHVRFRFKDDISNEFFTLIVGFNYEAQTVTINNSIYSFKELFKKFEFYKNQEWQPFGVLDES